MATIIDPPNSIWPNGLKLDSEGYVTFYPLGTNKVDISTVTWPDGDALVGNFVYKNGLLSGFVDTKALIVNEGKASTIPYDYVNIHLASIQEGEMEVVGGERTKYFIVTYGTGNVGDTIVLGTKYLGCTTINEVKAIEPNYTTVDVIDGAWTESLADLENGSEMFLRCSNLTSFNSDLSSLTNAEAMFLVCTNLTAFNVPNLSSLTMSEAMFSNCNQLTSFTADLSSLTNAEGMFYNCTNLTSFTSDLSSLTNGFYMFDRCKLDSASIKNIIDTINTVSSGRLTLGFGCTYGGLEFSQEIGYNDTTEILRALQAKGWRVDAQYNYVPTSTYSMRGTTEPSLPVFVKLIEVEETHDELKSFYTHSSLNGTKKYRLYWFHETTGSTEGYTQFASLEEAVGTLNIKPIERN